jgi:leucyl aminopeptidase (aminopeptidase T)
MPTLEHAVHTIVRDCLGVREGDQVVIVSDPANESLGLSFRADAEAAGADAVLALMAEREENGTEPPPPVAAALAAADVFIAPTNKSLSHTNARKAASDAGARGATLPGVTTEMLARVMTADLSLLRERSRAIAELLTAGDEAHVTCPRGTDLRLDLTGREALADDGDLTQPGAFGNLPCGEGFIAPAGGSGVFYAASLASIGLAEEPVELRVEDGQLAGASGGLGERFLERLRAHGSAGTNLAELGIGTNDRATLTGLILEDEKILGTVHVAFGASAGIGGNVAVPIHLDAVVLDATVDIGDTRVLDGGELVLEL